MSRHSVSTSTHSHKNIEFEISPFDSGDFPDDTIPTQAEDVRDKTEENILTIFGVITLSNLWSLVLVTIPVMIPLGSDNLYYKQE
jgi:hypothetical protein